MPLSIVSFKPSSIDDEEQTGLTARMTRRKPKASSASASSKSRSTSSPPPSSSPSPQPSPSPSLQPPPPPPIKNVSDSQDHHHLYVSLQRSDDHCFTVHKISLKDIPLMSSGSDKPFDFPEPIFTLPRKTYPSSMGFLASDSKIYMFGGGKPRPLDTTATTKTPNSHHHGAACYMFDTSPERNPHMGISELDRLNWGKFSPIVLGPVHGKFYSCSRNLAYRDLEEFDPETERWNPLPPPPPVNTGAEFIHRHSIAGDRLVFTSRIRVYAYHVVNQSWECLFGGDLSNLYKYSGKPIDYDYFSYNVGCLQHVQAHATGSMGKTEQKAVQGCSEIRREFADPGEEHNVLRIEENKVCVVGLGVHSLKPYVAVELFDVTSESPRALESHHRATYALPETSPWDQVSGLAASFVM